MNQRILSPSAFFKIGKVVRWQHAMCVSAVNIVVRVQNKIADSNRIRFFA